MTRVTLNLKVGCTDVANLFKKAGIQLVRNPILVSFVPKLGMPYRGLGSGIPRVMVGYREANLPEPDLIEDKATKSF